MTESKAESTPIETTTESKAESTTEQTTESTTQQKRLASRIMIEATSQHTTTDSIAQQSAESTSQHTTTDSIAQQSAENLKTETVTTSTIKTEFVKSNVDKTSLMVGIVVSVIGVLFIIIIVLKIITLKYRRQNSGYEMNKPNDENVCNDLPKWVNGPTLYTEPTIDYLPNSSLCFENLTYIQSEQDGTEEAMDN